jgi:hypothetical protein
MTAEQTFVDSALRSWRSNADRAGKFFGSLTNEELELQVAPTRNRLIYIGDRIGCRSLGAVPAATPRLIGCSDMKLSSLTTECDRMVSNEIETYVLSEVQTNSSEK